MRAAEGGLMPVLDRIYQRGFVRPEDVQPDDEIEPVEKHDLFEATRQAHLLTIENQIKALEARRLAVVMSLKSPSRMVLIKRPVSGYQGTFVNVAAEVGKPVPIFATAATPVELQYPGQLASDQTYDIGTAPSSQRSTLIAGIAQPVVRGASYDGVTDDTNAIQRALHAAATEAVSKAPVLVTGCTIRHEPGADERSIGIALRDAKNLTILNCHIDVSRDGNVLVRPYGGSGVAPPEEGALVQRTDDLGRVTYEKATTNAVIPPEVVRSVHGQFWSSLLAMIGPPRPDQVNVSDALAKTSDFLATPFGGHAGDRAVHYHRVICGCGYRMVRPFEHRFGACFSCGSTESIRDLDAESCVMTPACVAAGGKAPVH